jgi:hypothetical protein
MFIVHGNVNSNMGSKVTVNVFQIYFSDVMVHMKFTHYNELRLRQHSPSHSTPISANPVHQQLHMIKTLVLTSVDGNGVYVQPDSTYFNHVGHQG